MGLQSQTPSAPGVCLPLLDMSNPAHRNARALSVDEAAFRFRVARRTLYRWVSSGDIPAWRDERNHIKLLHEPTALALKHLRSR
jgi:excisionase family DNA binding protein